MTTIRAALAAGAKHLGDSGSETPGLDARLLLEWASGCDTARLVSAAQEELDPDIFVRFQQAVSERADGCPVARIVGTREFWGLEFELSPDTLVPRPDTETLVDVVLSHIGEPHSGWRGTICDLGTGSGAILIALMRELPQARGVGVDLAAGAIETARRNGERHGMSDRITWLQGDYAEVPGERFDVVVANPPYIPAAEIAGLALEVRAHDPHLALNGGADGLDAYRTIAARLPHLVRPGGFAALELGAGQAEAVQALTSREGLQRIVLQPDLAGIPRVLLAWWSPAVAPLPQARC